MKVRPAAPVYQSYVDRFRELYETVYRPYIWGEDGTAVTSCSVGDIFKILSNPAHTIDTAPLYTDVAKVEFTHKGLTVTFGYAVWHFGVGKWWRITSARMTGTKHTVITEDEDDQGTLDPGPA